MTALRPLAPRPAIGVLCCNEVAERPVQTVASRFVEPLAHLSGAIVLLVPAVIEAADASGIAARLDGLLLTGSRSHVAPHRYGGERGAVDPLDEARDEVALALAARMIELGKPVFGICRGMQEINVLFGGTLCAQPDDAGHASRDRSASYAERFAVRHDVTLVEQGRLATVTGLRRLSVNSVHEQGIGRLGAGLTVEAVADDGLVEAIAARPCGGDVLAVQWHPEWDVAHCGASQGFFRMIGEALRGGAEAPTITQAYRP